MPIVFGCCVGNQTGLQNTGRKLPGSEWPTDFPRGKKTTFLPAANAAFVASSHSRLTRTSGRRLRRRAGRIDPNLPLVHKRRVPQRHAHRQLAWRRRLGQRRADRAERRQSSRGHD